MLRELVMEQSMISLTHTPTVEARETDVQALGVILQ